MDHNFHAFNLCFGLYQKNDALGKRQINQSATF